MKTLRITHIEEPARDIPIKQREQAFRPVSAALLEAVKSRLARRFAAAFAGLRKQNIRQAVAEAEVLAGRTGLPHLFLPELAKEKVGDAWECLVGRRKNKIKLDRNGR